MPAFDATLAITPCETVLLILSNIFRAAALVMLVAAAPSSSAQAQTASPAVEKQQAVINSYERMTGELARRVEVNAGFDDRLVDIRIELERLARELIQSGVSFRPRLAEINARLQAIGPPPAENAPGETEQVSEERAALTREKAEINALIGEAESLSIRVNSLNEEIADIRRELFAKTLTRRYDVSSALGGEVFQEFSDEMFELYRMASSWLRFVFLFKLQSLLIASFLAIAAATVLMVGGRRLLGNLIAVQAEEEDPAYLSRLSIALWSAILPATELAVFFGAIYFFFDYFEVLRNDIREITRALFNVIVTVFFVYRLAKAALSPRRPKWRLLPVASKPAQRLVWLTLATATVTGLDFFLTRINAVLGSPLSLTIAQSLVATAAVGALVILIGLVKPFVDAQGRTKAWPISFRYLLYALGGVTISAALLGYLGFARFLAQQIVITGAILATMYIGFLAANAIAVEGTFARTALGRKLDGRFTLEDATFDQFGLIASILINILVVLIGVPHILLQWGFQWGDINAWAYGIANEIRIGSVSFSLVGILTGIFVFIVGYFITRWFQGWIDGSVMARGRVDSGVRNSIRTVVGYAGLAVAGLIGISAAGINLSSLALVAGGLSLGIGFGLQNVVSNFVSGLILLAERPFKAGDWITAGATSGIVKKISVRATEIETFQRQTVILPNSELINSAVANWTHRNKLGRTDLRLGVAYGSDVKRVHTVLLEIARAHPLVLKNPEPVVLFSNISDIALEFEARVFLSDIMNSVVVQNDLRFSIMEAFERENIGLPFQPRATSLAGELSPPPVASPAADAAVGETGPNRRRKRADPDR